jgi:prepilin-type N-terminal cleavage/methylation domain-containing protein
MKNRSGLTLIELMVVVLIVAVLAAILIPLLTARIESARWSEGKAGAGTIATAIRALYAEIGEESEVNFPEGSTDVGDFCNPEDLQGKYFEFGDYAIGDVALSDGLYPVIYTITVNAPADSPYTWRVATITLDETGVWSRTMVE